MRMITLTSDWSENDFYTGTLKGRIYSGCADSVVIDLSHRIKQYNTAQAAFVVRNAYPSFPEGTIHIIAVNSEPRPGCRLLAARLRGQYFISADNGIFGLLGEDQPEEVVVLPHEPVNGSYSLSPLYAFADAACALASGRGLSEIGESAKDITLQVPLRATIENNTITGSVIYIDSYGNAISNISRDLFQRIGAGRNFGIFVQSKHYRINQLNTYYSETQPGELLALFNSAGLIEIAIRNGSASKLLNLNTDSTIRVEFSEK
ncbi:MAG: SAM hydrolase/SAM-dependent halogenase family protein [Bacteroidota bacterium]